MQPETRSDRSASAEFARYRSEGDLSALGRAFDAVAPELLRVARHLCGPGPEAEDAVQETFLTAIERAGHYDPARPLVPWLTGILTNHARRERRLRGRLPEADRLAPTATGDPEDEAERGELRGLVEQHVAKLPATYAGAVRSYLFEGLAPREIAARLGISANATSVRLHRGLAKLRKALPAGVAFGAVVALRPERGLAAMRASVLGQAATAGGAKSAAAVGLGGAQLAWLAVGVTAAVGAGGWSLRGGDESPPSELQSVQAARPAEVVAEASAVEPAARTLPSADDEQPADAIGASAPDATITPADWLARFQAATSWRDGWAIGEEIAALPPDEGLAVMRAIYRDIPSVELRQQVLKPFVFHGGHPRAVDVLHLAATDPELEVQGWAFGYLEPYALRDFAADFAAYERWYARYADRPLAEVLRGSAMEARAHLASLPSEELAAELDVLAEADPRIGEVAGVDLLGLYREVGLLDQAAAWLGDPSHELPAAVLGWMEELPLEREFVEAHVLPRLERDEESRDALEDEACRVLGREGQDWATPHLLGMLEVRRERGGFAHAVCSAIGEVGDASALPELIAAFVDADDPDMRYSIGHFALAKLTGVPWKESHDGAFWLEWWDANQGRLPVELRGTSLPLGGN